MPAEYDVAVSTACGYLDFLVVETEAGGAACIEHLRKHNLGRTSFIVLSQINGKVAGALARPARPRARGGARARGRQPGLLFAIGIFRGAPPSS